MNFKGTGGPPMSPLLKRAVELTEDGEWHDFEKLLVEVGKLIAPGVAIRRTEQDRKHSGGPAERTKNKEDHRLITIGKRAIVRDALGKSYFEIKPVGHVPPGTPQQIRLLHLPNRLARDREIARRNDPTAMIVGLLETDDPAEYVRLLNTPQLRRLVLGLLTDLQDNIERVKATDLLRQTLRELKGMP